MSHQIVEKDSEVPLVHFRWLLPVGAGLDNRTQEGLANFAMEISRRGGDRRNRDETSKYLAQKASQLTIHITAEHTQITSLVPSHELEDFTNRLVDVLQDASSPEEEVSKLRHELLEGLEVSLESPTSRAGILWRRLLFADDSWGNMLVGSRSSLNRLTANNLNEKRNAMLQYPGVLAMAGDVNASQAEKLGTIFSGAFPELKQKERVQKFSSPSGHRLGLWHDPNQSQSTVVLGWAGPQWSSDEWVQLKMVEKILCREYSSLLCQDFRQRAGLTYGIYGAYQPTERGSLYRLSYSTSSRYGPNFLEDLLKVLGVFSKGKGTYSLRDQDGKFLESTVNLSGSVLEQCRLKTLSSLPFRYHTPQARLMRQLESYLYGIVSDQNAYREAVQKVVPGELEEVARKMFQVPSITVGIVDNMDVNGAAYQELFDWSEVVTDGEDFCQL